MPFILAHGLAVITAVGTICASLGLITWFIVSPEKAEEYLSGHRPTYFSSPIDTDRLDDYGPVFAVGHNAGATLKSTRQAIANGAGVIEIDVASMDGTLVAAHYPPLAMVGRRVFRGPTLEAVWRASTSAAAIQLDLKESTTTFRTLLFAFLEEHADNRAIIVTTENVTTLDLLMEQFPDVIRLLSVPDQARLQSLYGNTGLVAAIDGVTIRYQLVNAESVTRLKALDLIVIAWTVNDLATVNDFVQIGVDGISTDNLAIMNLLGANHNGLRLFADHRSGPATAQQPTPKTASSLDPAHTAGLFPWPGPVIAG